MAPSSTPRKPTDVSAASKEKNEYIPSFIAKKPFYVVDDSNDTSASGADYLEHQRLQAISTSEQKWYDRGKKVGPAATKFRKGACENCGAMTHKTKECLSRKRKNGARWTGKDIQADEVVQDVSLGWDAKRDRWNGYDAREYANVVKEYNTIEGMKKDNNGESRPDDTEVDDGAKYEEETDMGRQQSTSTRNLRLREDTAKYLLNLDLESAKYDPKTRSMVDSGATADQAAALVAEEGFMRASGDAAEFERAQRYAWEASAKGGDNSMHLQANPTAGELLRKKERDESDAKKNAQRKALLEKYGSQEHLTKDTSKTVVGVVESERFIEYDDKGRIKGAPPTKSKSKYAEDVFINNHTSVWGSWWHDFNWGYACCHSTVKNSYCTGEHGKKAAEAAKLQQTGATLEGQKQIEWDEQPHSDGEGTHGGGGKTVAGDGAARKRPLQTDGVSDEQMEEYRRKRVAADDPMANMLGRDELVGQ